MATYETFDYRTRPAKAVERRMISQVVARLRVLGDLQEYRYIGFGSTTFVDFILMHRHHGFRRMVSIERDLKKEKRFRENLPYRAVELAMGDSHTVLPALPWDAPAVVWLDYEQRWHPTMAADVDTVVTLAQPGTLLIVTVNAQPVRPPTGRAKSFEQTWGTGVLPLGWEDQHLNKDGLPALQAQLITERIGKAVADRSGVLAEADKLQYQQLLHFIYRDGAQMLTVGGLLYSHSQRDAVDHAAFDNLSFVRVGDVPMRLRVPPLTPKEVHMLVSMLPSDGNPTLPGVDDDDIEAFAEAYRYYPTYMDVEF